MKFNKWTLGLAAVGVVSLASAARADETKVSQLNTALSNTTISGYVDVAAQFNPGGGGYYTGTPDYSFGNKANGFNLNVVDIAIDKPEDATPWASGYHVEFWVGPDGNNLAVGDNIRSAYIRLNTPVGNGIDWQIGVWDTIIGYEGATSSGNPNYTHSYAYNLEPTSHTGILGTYKVADALTVQAGLADTSYGGNFAYNAGYNTGLYYPTVLGGATLTAPDSFGWAKGATLSGVIINTSGSGNGGATSYYAGFTLPTPIAALKTGGSFDYLNARDISVNAWDVAGYATYQFNDKLSVNLRAENLNAGGTETTYTYSGEGYTESDYYLSALSGGAFGTDVYNQTPDQQAQEITATVQYNLWANVLTRVEFRWDHVDHGYGYATYSTGTPEKNAFLLAAQAIYTF